MACWYDSVEYGKSTVNIGTCAVSMYQALSHPPQRALGSRLNQAMKTFSAKVYVPPSHLQKFSPKIVKQYICTLTLALTQHFLSSTNRVGDNE